MGVRWKGKHNGFHHVLNFVGRYCQDVDDDDQHVQKYQVPFEFSSIHSFVCLCSLKEWCQMLVKALMSNGYTLLA